MKYLVANWKSHMTSHEAIEWLTIFASFDLKSLSPDLKIIICPSFPLISSILSNAKELSISIGAQDVSSLPAGAHTGQVSIDNLSGLVEYVIVGHSESRRGTDVDNEAIKSKVILAKQFNIEPILCVSDKSQAIEGCNIVCFEPIEAIGTNQPEDIDQVVDFKNSLDVAPQHFLYGGSVSPENANQYIDSNAIDGFLVGTNSLNPLAFFEIAEQI